MKAKEFREIMAQKGGKNKKIRNAHRSERDGVKFDSDLEKYMYDLLKAFYISFEFQKKYVLQSGFRYNGEAIRPVTYTADFYLPDYNCIIDTKGYKTQQGTLRVKLLKHLLADSSNPPEIHLPKDRSECSTLVNKIIHNNG